ncbi:PAS domain S-box protein [Chloroflexi bacterium TSY]|nr:PAS domain S-box protein [Chloroflexi bacterium TSY]
MQQLQKELEHGASFPELNPSAIIELDLAGNIHFLNPAATRLFPNLQASGLEHLLLKDVHTVVATLKSEERTSLTDEVRIDNGWYQRVLHLVQKTDRVRLFVLDVTEHKRTEEAFRKERYLLRTLIDNLPDYIFVKDTESRFVVNNEAHLHVLGATTQEEVVGKTDFDMFPRELAEQYYADEQAIIRSGVSLVDREEITITPEGRKQWLSTTKVPLHDKHGTLIGLVGMSRDITKRKEAESKLQQTANELARSNAELEQFAYVASHDLQEPLRAITGYIQLIQRRYAEKLGKDADTFIERSVAAANRMKSLIEALLAYSRVGKRSSLVSQTNCSTVVAQTLNSLEAIIQENNASITYDSLPTVMADATQLGQLFQNLISNAIKFRGEQTPAIQIKAVSNDSEWLSSVHDNGIGIEPQYAERIFLIFQRLHTRSEYPGTGIGLAMCKKIVEHHGGCIWFESEPGQGTTFFFTLPLEENLHYEQ